MVFKNHVTLATPGQASQLSFPWQYSTHQHSRDTCGRLRCRSNSGVGRCSSSTPAYHLRSQEGWRPTSVLPPGGALSGVGFGNVADTISISKR